MRRFLLLLYLLAPLLPAAAPFYQAYDFNDSHYVKTVMPSGIAVDEVRIDRHLHVRSLESNGSNYLLFWLEDNASNRPGEIDTESIYAPFIVENNDSDGFRIKTFKSLSRDRDVIDRQIGIVDALQFAGGRSGTFVFRNALGGVKVNQSIGKNGYLIRYGRQLAHGTVRDDIEYIDTAVAVVPDRNTTWRNVRMKALMRIDIPVLKSVMIDRRHMQLTRSRAALAPGHWFLRLGPDMRKWPFGAVRKPPHLSFKEASRLFTEKEREILARADDREKLAAWALENMDFLRHLDKLLETRTLDDKASLSLFAILGYVDTAQSSTVLGKVLLDEKINDRERFRAMMGLKNTSAPLDDDTLDALISYGLSPDGTGMLQRGAGMFLGALAHQRARRAPSQTGKIGRAVAESIRTGENRAVALNAAANMKDAATPSVIRSVEETLVNDPDPRIRRLGAQALEQIRKSDLTVSTFETLYENEEDAETKAAIIRGSVAAKDFRDDGTCRDFLLNIAAKASAPASNRAAALDVLEKSGYGKTAQEKETLRRMMVGVRNEELLMQMLKLYRR